MDPNAPASSVPPRFTPPPPPGPPPLLRPTIALRDGWHTFASHAGISLLALLVYFAVAFAGSMVPFLGLLFGLVAQPALTAGAAGFLLRNVRGEHPPISALFDGFQRWSSVTGALLLTWCVQWALMMPFFGVMFASYGSRMFRSGYWGRGDLPTLSPLTVLTMFGALALTSPLIIWWWPTEASTKTTDGSVPAMASVANCETGCVCPGDTTNMTAEYGRSAEYDPHDTPAASRRSKIVPVIGL